VSDIPFRRYTNTQKAAKVIHRFTSCSSNITLFLTDPQKRWRHWQVSVQSAKTYLTC